MKNWLSKYWPLLVLVGYIMLQATWYLGVSSTVEEIPVNPIVAKNDSIVAEKQVIIDSLQNSIERRDSVITLLTTRETSQRDTVFAHIQDKFENATDSTKEALIDEAMSSIK